MNIEPGFTIFTPEGMPADKGAIEQMEMVMNDERAVSGALMADHHLGYSMPIGGVVAYEDAVSPTGVGFDIGCGNKAVRTNLNVGDFAPWQIDSEFNNVFTKAFQKDVKRIMRQIQKKVAFGLGRSNAKPIDSPVFERDHITIWQEIERAFGRGLFQKARAQLGTVGSGNHYVDLLVDENGFIWVANHFGSRGLGHTIASGFMAKAAGRGFTDKVPETKEAVVLPTKGAGGALGQFYIAAMQLAGEYAYAGRDYVVQQVLDILDAESTFEVHNHHNFAWFENGLWIVRKGATPLTPAPAFIGGSMGDVSVIVRGKVFSHEGGWDTDNVEDIGNLGSAPHGAGRIMSRNKAAGKMNWKTRTRDSSKAAINWTEVRADLTSRGITVLGAGADEAPGVYKPLGDVLKAHDNIEILHSLKPIGVVMAGDDINDPYSD